MGNQLAEFLRSKRDQTEAPEIDWQAKRQAWVKSIEALFDRIEKILADSIVSGDVGVRRFDMEITEEFVGRYTVPRLELTVGSERVEFRPMGVTVIGAAGRVDVRGDRGTVTLLRDEASSSGWIIVLQRIPRLVTEPLNPTALKYTLEKVMLPLV